MRPSEPVPDLREDPAFADLKSTAIALTGMAFYADKDDTLAAILARRMGALGDQDGRSYLHRLQGGEAAAERDALAAELTIGETYFLRHAAQWTAFTDRIVPDILARNADSRRLHIWSAGCATGAEAYTAAILLRDRFAPVLEGWSVSILGTDINRRFLEASRQARYGAWSFRALPDEMRDRCFTRVDGHWELKPEYRTGTSFQHHNLVSDRVPPSVMPQPDLILCRNVFIYFDAATNQRILDGFHAALPAGGWLMVGHAEPDMRLFRAFETIMLPDAVLHRKPEAGPPRPAPQRPSQMRPGHGRPAAPRGRTRPAQRPESRPPRPERAEPEMPALPLPEPVAPIAPVARTAGDTGHAGESGTAHRLMAENDWTGAATACDDWLRRDPMDPWAHVCLGRVKEHRGLTAEAIQAYRRALYLDRNALIAHYQLGCLLRPNDPAAAARCFRNVLDLSRSAEPTCPVPGAPGLTMEELRQAALSLSTQLERR